MPEICLAHNDAAAKMRETVSDVSHRIGILIQSKNIGAAFQKRFGVPAATTRSVENQQACSRVEQVKNFPLQDGAMVDEIVGRLC